MKVCKKKFIVALMLACSIMVCSVLPSIAASKTLFTSIQIQQNNYWCWAAASRQNGYWWANYNEPCSTRAATQTEIVTHVKGSPVLEGGDAYEQIDACKFAAYDKAKAKMTHSTYSMTYSRIKQDIDAGKPVQVSQLKTDLSGAHTVLVTGYSDGTGYQNVVYCDPWDGKKYTQAYSTFCNGWKPGYFWGYTVYWWSWS